MCDVVSAVTGGVALLGSMKGDKNAKRASNAQQASDAAQLEFQQQQYNDWKEVYGPIRENLSDFYQGLTPETFANSGIQALVDQFDVTQANIQKTFAQRGLDSGTQDFLNQNAELDLAKRKAAIRADAPMQVASAQQSFLNSNISNPNGNNVANAMQNQSNNYGNQATQYNNQAMAGYQAAGSAISSGVEQYYARQTATPNGTI